MKKFWDKIKPVLILCTWMLFGGSLVALLGASINHQQKLSFQSISVNIDQSNGMLFLDQQDIFKILKDDQLTLNQSKPIEQVNYDKLERVIENNPFVENAELFIDASHIIRINIVQRTPILRVINNAGVSYYIDEHARKMPLSGKFTARVPVATGNIFAGSENENKTDSVTERKLAALASYINSDTFLTSLTEQIVVNNQREFELIPRIGNHSVLIGDTDNLEKKFEKLKIFYRQGLNHTGWNDYSRINLKYENEVYCTKRNGKTAVVASVDSSGVERER